MIQFMNKLFQLFCLIKRIIILAHQHFLSYNQLQLLKGELKIYFKAFMIHKMLSYSKKVYL
jgi:hypothetical protein